MVKGNIFYCYLEFGMRIPLDKIYFISLLSKNGFRMSHKVSNNTSH